MNKFEDIPIDEGIISIIVSKLTDTARRKVSLPEKLKDTCIKAQNECRQTGKPAFPHEKCRKQTKKIPVVHRKVLDDFSSVEQVLPLLIKSFLMIILTVSY